MSGITTATPRSIDSFLSSLVVTFVIANFLLSIVLLIEPFAMDVLGGVCLAMIGAQVALLNVWFVFAPLPIGRRLIIGLVVGGVWLAASTIIFLVSIPYVVGLLAAFLSLPILMLAIQTPLWVMKVCFNWRVVRMVDGVATPPRRPLRILDLMIATGAIAIVLGLARLGSLGHGFSRADHIFELLGSGTFLGFLSAISLIPCIWAELRGGDRTRALTIAIGVHAAIAAIPLLLVLMEPFVGFSIFLFLAGLPMAGYVTLVLCILSKCRRYGFRLRWGRE